MPKLTKKLPAYRMHRASGQAVVSFAGRDHYLGPHGTKSSKAQYDRLVCEWLSTGRSPTFGVEASELTIVELLVAYLRFARSYYGDKAQGEYTTMKIAIRPLKELYSENRASEFGPAEFKAVRQRIIATGVSRTYINATMRRVLRVFRWGASEALRPVTVPQTLAMVPGLAQGRCNIRETDPVRPGAIDLVEATLPHLSHVVSGMVQLQMLTGCRPGEVCKLKPEMIDRTGDVWEARLVEHKTAHRGKERVFYFGPKAQEILRPFLLRPSDSYCFSPQEAEARRRGGLTERRVTPPSCGHRVGTNRLEKTERSPGDCYTTSSYARAIRRACIAGALEHWSPNQIRHATATRIRREFGVDAAATLLGHADPQTTLIYAEADRARAVEVTRRIG